MNIKELKERIWRIADGVPLDYGDMTVRMSNTDKLLVTGWTNTVHFENISRTSALRDLSQLKNSFSVLTDSYSELLSIVTSNDLTIEYHIAYDDAGKAGIGLCSEIDGKINWYIE